MINSKQAARLRAKVRAGRNLTDANKRRLEEYEASRGNDLPPAGGESPAGAPAPGDHAPAGGEAVPPPPPIAPPPRVDPMEPPPEVAPQPVSTSSSSGKKGDWRDRYRAEINASDDGREMICEMVGGGIATGLLAMCDEMKKAGISPLGPIEIDTKKLHALYVLFADDVLPARARATPRVIAAGTAATIIGRRYWFRKEIAEALKNDPDHQEWLRDQAKREQAEQANRAAHEAEVAAASAPPPAAPQYADPSPPSEPSSPHTNGTAILARPEPRVTRAVPLAEDPDALF